MGRVADPRYNCVKPIAAELAFSEPFRAAFLWVSGMLRTPAASIRRMERLTKASGAAVRDKGQRHGPGARGGGVRADCIGVRRLVRPSLRGGLLLSVCLSGHSFVLVWYCSFWGGIA